MRRSFQRNGPPVHHVDHGQTSTGDDGGVDGTSVCSLVKTTKFGPWLIPTINNAPEGKTIDTTNGVGHRVAVSKEDGRRPNNAGTGHRP